jgi:hypothetical protein
MENTSDQSLALLLCAMDQPPEVISSASSAPSIGSSSAPATPTVPSPLALPPISPSPPLSSEPLSLTVLLMQHCRHVGSLHQQRKYAEAQEVWIQLQSYFEVDVEPEDTLVDRLFRATKGIIFPVPEEMPSELDKTTQTQLGQFSPGLWQWRSSRG